MVFSSNIDLFHADGSPIQQQIGEIYNRYSLLSTKLSDRQLELDTMRDECKKHSETLRSLATFLDKIERQMPRDSAVPQTRDDAEKQLRSVKNILEDMYDKQPMLDGLRSQVIIFHLFDSLLLLKKKSTFLDIGTASSEERCSRCGCSSGSVGCGCWTLEGSAGSLQGAFQVFGRRQRFPGHSRPIVCLVDGKGANDVRLRPNRV